MEDQKKMRIAERRFDTQLAFKGVSENYVDVVRLKKKIEAGDKTRIEMKGVNKDVSGCKESFQKIFHLYTEWKNVLIELRKVNGNLNKVNEKREEKFIEWSKERIEWNKKRIELRKNIDNLKKENYERMKEIEKWSS